MAADSPLPSNPQQKLDAAANHLAEATDSDVLLYSGPIDHPFDISVVNSCRRRRRRKNVILVLVTFGGDADSAFRIARCLQTKYERFTLLVSGFCKSAGTLVAIGANELVVADTGELGPLDVQMAKEDSLWESQSGLTVNAALTALQLKAFLAFEQFFLEMERNTDGAISVHTAGKIATELTVGLFAPLYSQVDPFHVGEAARAMSVAQHYGHILARASSSVTADGLNNLVSNYPAHGFVIDREQAAEIFQNVRAPSDAEEMLVEALGEFGRMPGTRCQIVFLSDEKAEVGVVDSPVDTVAGIADHGKGYNDNDETSFEDRERRPNA